MIADSAGPFADPNPRFALAGSAMSLLDNPDGGRPSERGVRPWGLLRARPVGPGRVIPAWTYDDAQQLAVDASGRALVYTVHGDPTAETTSTTDGEDGPSSEDWDND